MLTIQKQLEKQYKNIEPDNMIIGKKYLLVFSNYKIFGVFKNLHKRQWNYTKYGIIESHICDISPNGYKVFSLQDIRIKQVHRYFIDILPYEINIIIGKKWAEL